VPAFIVQDAGSSLQAARRRDVGGGRLTGGFVSPSKS
jgi:hypothetical protein